MLVRVTTMPLISSISASGGSFSAPDIVYNSMEILDVDDVNEAEMYFGMQFFLVTIWTDHRLNTSSLDSIPLGRLLLPDYSYPCFWAPSIVFDNDREETMFRLTYLNSVMLVYSNKTVVRASRFSLGIRCSIDLTLYPIDVQHCHFRMRLIDQPDTVAQLRWVDHDNETSISGMIPHGLKYNDDINLIKYKLGTLTRSSKTRSWLRDHFSYLCIHFPFYRRLTSSIVTIFIPSTLTVITSWVSFWMDVDAVPARTTLGLMSILTIITQILDVRKILPAINYVTAIDYWLFVCLIFVFVSFIEFAFAYTVVRKSKLCRTNAVQHWARPTSVEGTIVLNNKDSKEELVENGRVHERHEDIFHRILHSLTSLAGMRHSARSSAPNENSLDHGSKYAFPACFVIFACVYWTYYWFFKQEPKPKLCDFA
ncbi:Gamma-aminobutyric acid receptor subunit beta-1 [Halotydeus destructor]|nr:Gamma-aminobutyric acid receptor subunit beta-1 [Halotydeus destructor]